MPMEASASTYLGDVQEQPNQASHLATSSAADGLAVSRDYACFGKTKRPLQLGRHELMFQAFGYVLFRTMNYVADPI